MTACSRSIESNRIMPHEITDLGSTPQQDASVHNTVLSWISGVTQKQHCRRKYYALAPPFLRRHPDTHSGCGMLPEAGVFPNNRFRCEQSFLGRGWSTPVQNWSAVDAMRCETAYVRGWLIDLTSQVGIMSPGFGLLSLSAGNPGRLRPKGRSQHLLTRAARDRETAESFGQKGGI